MSKDMRLIVIGLIVMIALGGAAVYLAQTVQPAQEMTVDIIPNKKFR